MVSLGVGCRWDSLERMCEFRFSFFVFRFWWLFWGVFDVWRGVTKNRRETRLKSNAVEVDFVENCLKRKKKCCSALHLLRCLYTFDCGIQESCPEPTRQHPPTLRHRGLECATSRSSWHLIWDSIFFDFFNVSRKNGETKCIKIPAKCCKNSIPDSPRPGTSCAAQCRPPYVGQATVAQCPAGNTMMQPLIWTSGSQREGF